jgi:hypothetical protein
MLPMPWPGPRPDPVPQAKTCAQGPDYAQRFGVRASYGFRH